MLELIKTLTSEFERKLADIDRQWVERTVSLPEEEEKAVVAIGMRRSGKTFCLFQKIRPSNAGT